MKIKSLVRLFFCFPSTFLWTIFDLVFIAELPHSMNYIFQLVPNQFSPKANQNFKCHLKLLQNFLGKWMWEKHHLLKLVDGRWGVSLMYFDSFGHVKRHQHRKCFLFLLITLFNYSCQPRHLIQAFYSSFFSCKSLKEKVQFSMSHSNAYRDLELWSMLVTINKLSLN